MDNNDEDDGDEDLETPLSSYSIKRPRMSDHEETFSNNISPEIINTPIVIPPPLIINASTQNIPLPPPNVQPKIQQKA